MWPSLPELYTRLQISWWPTMPKGIVHTRGEAASCLLRFTLDSLEGQISELSSCLKHQSSSKSRRGCVSILLSWMVMEAEWLSISKFNNETEICSQESNHSDKIFKLSEVVAVDNSLDLSDAASFSGLPVSSVWFWVGCVWADVGNSDSKPRTINVDL